MIVKTEKKDPQDAIMSSRRFCDLPVIDKDDLLEFLTLYYLVSEDEDAANTMIKNIHLRSTCLDCIECVRENGLDVKWIPVLMDHIQFCIDVQDSDTMRL